MNELEILYADIEKRGIEAIQSGKEIIENNLNHRAQDQRRALTLLISLQGPIIQKFRMLKREIQKAEPYQYYYPDADLHVTAIELICATTQLPRDREVLQQGIEIVETACNGIAPFEISFRGIIASNGAILARGYYQSGLLELRQNVRSLAQQCGFDLRERYQSLSAHTVFGRFTSPIKNRQALLDKIQEYHAFELGAFQVRELDLVIHDCYHHEKEEIQKFTLGIRPNVPC